MLIIVVGFVLAIFAPILSRLVQMAVSRRREFLADASGAELTRYPDGLADALEKIKNTNKGNMKVSESVSHLFISDPTHSALDAIYSTHPPIEERIKRLREM
jgi:heat shock protein HtpX